MIKKQTSIQFMSRSEIQDRVRLLREELEARHKNGLVKMAGEDGEPIPTEDLQNKLYSLIYRLSKME
jgi:hypothetical protein